MTPEQAGLVRKASDSIKGANLLATNGFYDFAASRAYYAMFYIAEALLLDQGLAFSRHAAVIAAFGQRFARPGIVPVVLHRYLIDGQDKRTLGDYGTGPGLTEEQAAEQIAHAEDFLIWAERLLGPLPLTSETGP